MKARIERSFRRKDALEFGIRKGYGRLQIGRIFFLVGCTVGHKSKNTVIYFKKGVLGLNTNTRAGHRKHGKAGGPYS